MFTGRGKRGAVVWLSWLIVIAVVISISSMVFIWSQDFTMENMNQTKQRYYSEEMCDMISIKIGDVYYKNPKTLNILATNSYNLRVEKLIFEFFAKDTLVGDSIVLEKIIRPGHNKSIQVPVPSSDVDKIQVVPATSKGGHKIICDDKRVSVKLDK